MSKTNIILKGGDWVRHAKPKDATPGSIGLVLETDKQNGKDRCLCHFFSLKGKYLHCTVFEPVANFVTVEAPAFAKQLKIAKAPSMDLVIDYFPAIVDKRTNRIYSYTGNRSIKKELSILEKFGKELKALEVK